MSETQTTSAAASVAAGEATLRRSIQMKNFISKAKHDKYKAQILSASADAKPVPDAITLGQVIGHIFEVQERDGQLPDGTVKTSLLGIGEFEGTNYETGEVFAANAAYLPAYFLQTTKAMLAKGVQTVEFALEIVLEPTGKSIPTAYAVRPLLARRADSVMNRLKAELHAAGRLRLPPPVAMSGEAVAGEVRQIAPAEVEAEDADQSGEGDPPAEPAKGKGAKAA